MNELDELIKGCIAHNRIAQEKLYKKFYPSLFLLCRRFFADERDAMEALNDGMLKVFRNIARYKPAGGEFFNWAYTVVRNASLDKLKLSTPPVTQPLTDNMDGPGLYKENPLQSLEQKDVYVLLDALQPTTRAVCSLFYIEGFLIREISERLLISRGTVKWHLSETRKYLRVAFKNYYSN